MLLKVLVYAYLTNSYSSRKIEANANRYSFVWGKSIRHNKERILKQIDELWSYAQRIAYDELQDTEPLVFDEIKPEQIKQVIEQIDQALKNKTVDKKVRQKLS